MSNKTRLCALNEVTVTKSDGSKVEVHLNGSFAVNDHGPFGG